MWALRLQRALLRIRWPGMQRPLQLLWPQHFRKRGGLWSLLVLLVALLLLILVWLAGRYEASQLQSRLEHDSFEAMLEIRAALTRNVQNMLALQVDPGRDAPERWRQQAHALLREHREIVRLEWHDPGLRLHAGVDTPYRNTVFLQPDRNSASAQLTQACQQASRTSGPVYSSSYFQPQSDGLGLELIDMCLPLAHAGRPSGYMVATYALQQVLSDFVSRSLRRGHEVSFTEADGTRLALFGTSRRTGRVFSAQQLLDLPGYTMVLRMDSWRAAPDLFPNVLTALVTTMAIALVVVLWLLGKDIRRRLRAEHDLADALAFRKAMEDSLVTGLRARDLQGHITYVNPAFCEMLGFEPRELLGQAMPAPYWPPEMIDEYGRRQALRLAGNAPPREGSESIFMRKNGERFPVLIFEAPLINAAGFQTGWMSAILDISAQRRSEELTRTSQERLQATARLATVGEMASLLSHELNQPLAAIASYASGSQNLLQADILPDREAQAELRLAVQRIAEQAERAGRVIQSVHDFVRRRDSARTGVKPQVLLDAILPLVSLQARKLQVSVKLEVDQSLEPVWCDPTMVEQVLLNLARNGMQAMDSPSCLERVLTLSVRRAPAGVLLKAQRRWVEFAVADRGPGIAQDIAEQLFTPFFTTKDEGMGLGLSLCRTVIEQHGGMLLFEPCAPQGTVFRFTLPLSAP